MDVLITIGHMRAGGTQRVVSNLANAWTTQGLTVGITTLADPAEDFFELDPAIVRSAIAKAPKPQLVGSLGVWLRRIRSLRRNIRKSKPDFVISFITPLNLQVILATIGLRIRLIVCERNDPRLQFHALPWRFLRWALYRFADVVTANSRGAVEALSRYVPEKKLAFVPNPVEVPYSVDAPSDRENVVLTVGRLTRQKGHDVLLQAFARLSDRHADWKLSIIGDGELRDALRDETQHLGIASRVRWIYSTSKTTDNYTAASVFVLASRFEGMPNALIEAMGCGLAAVVSDSSSGPLELITDGVNGLVVPTENPAALANALERLMSDPPLRQQLGKAAREVALQYDLPAAINQWNKSCGLPRC